MKIKLRWGDFILFALIVLAAVGIWVRFALMQTDQVKGEIWVEGELYKTVALADGYSDTITFQGRNSLVTIEIDGKRMRFIESQCPDHTCETMGWVSSVGATAVCLPNRTMIKLVGTGSEGVDAVVF